MQHQLDAGGRGSGDLDVELWGLARTDGVLEVDADDARLFDQSTNVSGDPRRIRQIRRGFTIRLHDGDAPMAPFRSVFFDYRPLSRVYSRRPDSHFPG